VTGIERKPWLSVVLQSQIEAQRERILEDNRTFRVARWAYTAKELKGPVARRSGAASSAFSGSFLGRYLSRVGSAQRDQVVAACNDATRHPVHWGNAGKFDQGSGAS
jgi:hypothetical protein